MLDAKAQADISGPKKRQITLFYPVIYAKLADGNTRHMKTKVLFFIALGSLLTVTALYNRHEVSFWFFGMHSVSLPWLLGGALAFGLVGGVAISRSGKAKRQAPAQDGDAPAPRQEARGGLDEADRDYIS